MVLEKQRVNTALVTIEGKVADKAFSPAQNVVKKSESFIPSKFSFSIQTENGLKAFQVVDGNRINKETVEVQVVVGQKVLVNGYLRFEIDKDILIFNPDFHRVEIVNDKPQKQGE